MRTILHTYPRAQTRWRCWLFKYRKMIFRIVDEPPSLLDVDDSLESTSEPDEEEEEEDMPEDKDTSLRSGV